jgi:aryl-alcohol dehydrogenase-like predicted oxidoreductase
MHSVVRRFFVLTNRACFFPRVEEIAKKREISMAQVSIAWSLSKEGGVISSESASVLFIIEGISAPIVGTTSIANLADAIGMFGQLTT